MPFTPLTGDYKLQFLQVPGRCSYQLSTRSLNMNPMEPRNPCASARAAAARGRSAVSTIGSRWSASRIPDTVEIKVGPNPGIERRSGSVVIAGSVSIRKWRGQHVQSHAAATRANDHRFSSQMRVV
ncbi:MAG: hypothetical protein U0Y68_02465 [Blastocatellia bacterium]